MSDKGRVDGIAVEVFFWDWKDQPCIADIIDASIQINPGGSSHFSYQPETNSDEHCCVIAAKFLNGKQVIRAMEYDFDKE